MTSGDVAYAVHRAAGDIDEAFHAGRFAREHQRLETLVVDRPAERRVEVEARIVRDARHVDDMVAASDRVRVFGRVADISGNNFQVRMRRQPSGAEEHEVVNDDSVSGCEKFWDENTSFVAGAPGNQNFLHGTRNKSCVRDMASHL